MNTRNKIKEDVALLQRVKRLVAKAVKNKQLHEDELAEAALAKFSKYPTFLYSKEEMIAMFKAGLKYAQTWHEPGSEINGDKLTLLYNFDDGSFDIAWYEGKGGNFHFKPLDEIVTDDIYAKLIEKQIRDDIKFAQEDPVYTIKPEDYIK